MEYWSDGVREQGRVKKWSSGIVKEWVRREKH
jgi:hypothetical protein